VGIDRRLLLSLPGRIVGRRLQQMQIDRRQGDAKSPKGYRPGPRIAKTKLIEHWQPPYLFDTFVTDPPSRFQAGTHKQAGLLTLLSLAGPAPFQGQIPQNISLPMLFRIIINKGPGFFGKRNSVIVPIGLHAEKCERTSKECRSRSRALLASLL
jgi:hypothetical protein